MADIRVIKVKGSCCSSNPRCKRCPVVAKRLARVGLAERISGRRYAIFAPKKAITAARRNRLKPH